MTSDSHEALQERWVRVDLGALADNTRTLKALLGSDGPRLMAVVKANAYGHGAAGIATVLRAAGADWFGVTTLNEGLELVRSGIDSRATPVLVFSPLTQPEQVRAAAAFHLHMTVCDESHLATITGALDRAHQAQVHLNVDTGMGRFGLNAEDALRLAAMRPSWAGVYTHFANAAEAGLTATMRQLHAFRVFLSDCRREEIDVGIRHCANSAAALRAPDSRFDMVRIGTALYGQMPSGHVPCPEGLRADTFQVQARVVYVRELRAGAHVGYGSEYIARYARSVAVVPIGFADGFGVAPTSLYRGMRGARQMVSDRRSRPHVLFGGRRAAVLGRIAMQTIVVDVTGFDPPVRAGDIAVVPMRRLSVSALLPRRYEPV